STIITCKSFYFTCFFSLKAHALKKIRVNKVKNNCYGNFHW
ncbi:hypothetical protein cco106_01616, partial [Campylobacter coli 2553]